MRILTLFAGFLASIPREKRWWQFLFWVNLLGSFFGFWWYREQLLSTPVKYWLVVPDSPGSTLLFSFFLLLLEFDWIRRSGNRPIQVTGWVGLLAALAFVSNMKYGLWTATVLPLYALRSGVLTFDTVHLSLSHFGMWVQGIVFAQHYRLTPVAAFTALAWMLIQDYVDYWLLHTHPTLPAEWLEPSARAVALGLSAIWGIYLVWQAWRDTRGKAYMLGTD